MSASAGTNSQQGQAPAVLECIGGRELTSVPNYRGCMSAWMCSNAHFDLMAQYAARRNVTLYPRTELALAQAREVFANERPDLSKQAKLVGSVLRDQNARSIEHRYPDTQTNNDMGNKSPYRFKGCTIEPTPAMVIHAADCYSYQACETPDWKDTLAYAICDAVREAAIRVLIEGQPWGIEEEHVRTKHTATA